jgi:two-component system LytT family sensor kinase
MERELLQLEFDRLKKQLNPHFLFNNLNILSSLITTDSTKASYYLNELSKVYRYLLRRNHEDFSSLKEELAFINSYAALIQIRFGNAVQIVIEDKSSKQIGMLPVLSLQLVVENAIKHNIAHKTNPLIIEIYVTNNNYVRIRNNIQKKLTTIISNRIGLANIQSKYRLLKINDMKIYSTTDFFEVQLPLITNLNYNYEDINN